MSKFWPAAKAAFAATALAVVAAMPASATLIGYRVDGTLDDGGTFSGTFSYPVGPDATYDYAEGGYWYRSAWWSLTSWNIVVSGGEFWDGVTFSSTYPGDIMNHYAQTVTRDGASTQGLFLMNDTGQYFSFTLPGAFAELLVSEPFDVTQSLYVDGSVFGDPMPAPTGLLLGPSTLSEPTPSSRIQDIHLSPVVPEPSGIVLVLLGLGGVAAARRRATKV